MAFNLGNAVRSVSRIDLTPGFQLTGDIHNGIPFIAHDNETLNNMAASKAAAAAPKAAPVQADPTPLQPAPYVGGGAGSGAADYSPADLAFLDSQEGSLRSLLGRTDTGLAQGLSRLNDDYQGNVNQQNAQKDQAISNYGDQRVTTNQDKLKGYDTINKGANNGYKSLAQIIGRASGTGSSAFQEMLPDVIGKDISGKRGDVNTTYGTNMQNIDKAQKETELSFASILEDLARQRSQGENDLRTGVENQRQTLNSQIGTIEGQKAQAAGGGFAAVKAAQAPTQSAIENSRNAVENFFNQFNPGIKAGQATVATPELGNYTVDRSNINAGNAGAPDPTNPYSDILRKKLQDQAAV